METEAPLAPPEGAAPGSLWVLRVPRGTAAGTVFAAEWTGSHWFIRGVQERVNPATAGTLYELVGAAPNQPAAAP